MYCKNCGNQISDDALFCSKCGTNQNEVVKSQYTNTNDETTPSFLVKLYNHSKSCFSVTIFFIIAFLVIMQIHGRLTDTLTFEDKTQIMDVYNKNYCNKNTNNCIKSITNEILVGKKLPQNTIAKHLSNYDLSEIENKGMNRTLWIASGITQDGNSLHLCILLSDAVGEIMSTYYAAQECDLQKDDPL